MQSLEDRAERLRQRLISRFTGFSRAIIVAGVAADMAAFDSLPAGARGRPGLRRAVFHASVRRHGAEDVADSTGAQSTGQILALVIILGGFVLAAAATGSSIFTSASMYLVGALSGVGIFIAASRPFSRRQPRVALARFAIVTFLGVPLLSILLSVLNWSALTTSWPARPLVLGWNVSMAGVLAALIWIWAWVMEGMRRVGERCRPTDGLLLRTVRVAGSIHRDRHRWSSEKTCARWCQEIQMLADKARANLAQPWRTGPGSQALRRELDLEAARVAEVFRAHRRVLVTASGPDAVDRVVESLIFAIVALAEGDREALLLNAPIELPLAARKWSGVIARLWPPLVLFAAGAVVPLIPSVAASAAVAASVRWTLISTGVLLLATANTEARSRVESVLDKALWK